MNDVQQEKLASRALLPQLLMTDSMVTRRLSNTTTIASSTALADAVAVSTTVSEGGGISPCAQQQQREREDAAAAAKDAAAAAEDDGSGVRPSSSGDGGGSTAQQRQAYPKASFSFVPRQDAGLSPDRQESCQFVLSGQQGNQNLYELQHEELQQQPMPDPLLSRSQLQQRHDQAVKTNSQKALLQQQQQQPPGPLSGKSFGSPFSSADKLPENLATPAAAAAADRSSSDSDNSWDDAASEGGIHGRDSSSSTESTRIARQATLSTMLQLPAGSGATSRSSSAGNSGQLPGGESAAVEGVVRSSGSGSGLVRLYRSSSSSNKTLPTLFEGYAASGLQQRQQGQDGPDQQDRSQELPPAQVKHLHCWRQPKGTVDMLAVSEIQ